MDIAQVNLQKDGSQLSGKNVSPENVPRYIINTCLVCNAVFLTHKEGPLHEDSARVKILCDIFQVSLSPDEDKLAPEKGALCRQCNTAVEEFLKLKKQIQGLVKMLEELRLVLGKKIADSYSDTRSDRRNYHVKTKIYEAWKERTATNSLNYFEQSFRTIVDSISGSTAQQHTDINATASSQSYPEVVTGTNIVTISENDLENDRFSTECFSPASPLFADDAEGNLSEVENESTMISLAERKRISEDNETQPTLVAVECNLNLVPPETTRATTEKVPSKNFITVEHDEDRVDKRKNRPIVVTNRRNHPCRFCSKLFPTDFSLQMHERTHTGDKPFPCTICGRPFNNKAGMLKHMQTHDPSRYQGEPEHECNICGKKYHLKLTLYTHKRDHLGIKRVKRRKPRDPNAPRKRKRSSKNDTGQPSAKSKVKKEKSEGESARTSKRKIKTEPKLDEDGNPIVQAPKTKRAKKASRPESEKPKRAIRRQEKRPTTCSYCGKAFKDNFHLKCHLYTHTGEKPYKCAVCGRGFAHKGNVDKHMKSHDPDRFVGEPKHICDFCGKAFHVPGTLYHHRRRKHLGLAELYKRRWDTNRKKYRKKIQPFRPCECKICGEKFNSLFKLNYHRKRKHGEERFKCDICERPFFESVHIKEHVKSHDPTHLYNKLFRYQCPSCPPERLGFPSKRAVRTHWFDQHKDHPLPDEFKRSTDNGGEFICSKCPEVDGKKPTYKHSRSLDKHNRLFHSDNPSRKGKSWKPKHRKDKSRRSLREDDMSMSDEYSPSESEYDSDICMNTKESVRKSPRATSLRPNLFLDDDSDNDSEEEQPNKTVDKIRTRKLGSVKGRVIRQSTISKIKRANHQRARSLAKKESPSSTMLTESYIRNILKGRELHIILTRVDANVTPLENNSSKNVHPNGSDSLCAEVKKEIED